MTDDDRDYDSGPEIVMEELLRSAEGRAEEAEARAIGAERLRVVAAAVRFSAANRSLVHNEVRELIFSVPRPGRHHNVMYLAALTGVDFRVGLEDEQGFLLSDGSFANRTAALAVATAAGQIIRRVGGDERALFSENLW